MVDVGNFDNLDEAYENGLATGRKEGAIAELKKLIKDFYGEEINPYEPTVKLQTRNYIEERLKELDKK